MLRIDTIEKHVVGVYVILKGLLQNAADKNIRSSVERPCRSVSIYFRILLGIRFFKSIIKETCGNMVENGEIGKIVSALFLANIFLQMSDTDLDYFPKLP